MRPRAWYNSAVRTNPVSSPLRLVAFTLSLVLATACARRQAPDPAYVAELEAWRAKRLASLTADDGWLSLVGLFWLKPGTNRFGSAPGNEVVLPGDGIPPVAGLLDLADGAVTLRTAPEAAVLVNDVPATEQWLATDRSGRADVVRVGSLRFHVIERAGQLGVRVKDPDNRARREFKGIEHFPIDPAARVEGVFERYQAPREVTVASAHGPDQRMLVTGVVRFRIGVTECALEPFVGSPEDRHFFFVFRDADRWRRDLRGRTLPRRRGSGSRLQRGDPRLQPRHQPPVRLHAVRHLPPPAAAERPRGPHRGRREGPADALIGPTPSSGSTTAHVRRRGPPRHPHGRVGACPPFSRAAATTVCPAWRAGAWHVLRPAGTSPPRARSARRLGRRAGRARPPRARVASCRPRAAPSRSPSG